MARLLTKRRAVAGLLCALFVGVCIGTRSVWLSAMGRMLVLNGGNADSSPVSADAIGIPDSPWLSSPIGSDRPLFAAGWIRERRAKVVVMTCGIVYGVSGCEMAQRNLAAQGKPPLPLRQVLVAPSPAEVEAAALMDEVVRTGARSAVILVDPLGSRRLNGIYQREGAKRGIATTVLYVPDPDLHAADWWRVREGRKALVYELCQWAGIP